MLGLKWVYYIVIIVIDYVCSKVFYCDILGFML